MNNKNQGDNHRASLNEPLDEMNKSTDTEKEFLAKRVKSAKLKGDSGR